MICNNQVGAVRAVDAATRKINAVLFRVIRRARGHHAKTETAHLLRQEPRRVERAGGITVALQKYRAAELIDRVGDLAEQPAEGRFPCAPGITGQHFAIADKLRHAHVLHVGADRRHAARGGEEKQVAVKQSFL